MKKYEATFYDDSLTEDEVIVFKAKNLQDASRFAFSTSTAANPHFTQAFIKEIRENRESEEESFPLALESAV